MPLLDARRRVDERDRDVVGDDVARRPSRWARPRSTLPATAVFGSAESVTVAVWPTLILVASASAKPATTSSFARFAIVTTMPEEARRARVRGAAGVWLRRWRSTTSCPRVSPTLALTAVTVPLIGARSTVARTALAAVATVILCLRAPVLRPARPWRSRRPSRRSPAPRRPPAAAARPSAFCCGDRTLGARDRRRDPPRTTSSRS